MNQIFLFPILTVKSGSANWQEALSCNPGKICHLYPHRTEQRHCSSGFGVISGWKCWMEKIGYRGDYIHASCLTQSMKCSKGLLYVTLVASTTSNSLIVEIIVWATVICHGPNSKSLFVRKKQLAGPWNDRLGSLAGWCINPNYWHSLIQMF